MSLPGLIRDKRRRFLDLVDRTRFRVGGREAREGCGELASAHATAEWFDIANRRIPGGSTQIASEIVEFVEFARARRPRTFVEIGTQAGGTNFLIARAIESIETVVAVDLFVENRSRLHSFARGGVTVTAIDGDSKSPATVGRVRDALCGREIDLLLIDGDHSFAGVLGDLRAYRPLVAPHGLIALHDIVPDEQLRTGRPSERYSGEVPLLWGVLREQFPHREFVADWAQDGLGIGVLENVRELEIVIDPGPIEAVSQR